ncbi:hypothetical protein EJ07DRAFT_153240 [Lizonia empirigonia]|nr:hypothetical protein EJ07DRAFT_153240 [Lizonia empirigonia]
MPTLQLTKFLTFLLLVVSAAALPTEFFSTDTTAAAHCQPDCQTKYTHCVSRISNVDVCRELVCNDHDNKCTTCPACAPDPRSPSIVPTDFTSTTTPSTPSTKRSPARKPPPSVCILLCVHAYCDLLCADASTSSTAQLLASTNAQSDRFGIALAPGSSTVVLAQKDGNSTAEACAWICSASSARCTEQCWTPGDRRGELVAVGGELAGDETVKGVVGCEVVEKEGVGRMVVCSSVGGVQDGGVAVGDGNGGAGLRCVLYWRGEEPYLGC